MLLTLLVGVIVFWRVWSFRKSAYFFSCFSGFVFVFLQVFDEDGFDIVASVAVYSSALIVNFRNERLAQSYADLVLVHLPLVLLLFLGWVSIFIACCYSVATAFFCL